jgi:lysyl endopeptidase
MKPILLLTMLLALFSQLANGQVKTNFNNAEVMTSKGKFGKNFQAKSPRIIPAKDIKSLLEREAKEENLSEAKPFKIAEAVKVDIDVVKEAAWIEEAGFAHGKYTIVANGAKSISANFDRFKLPKGTELYVYSANGEMITGPVTESENNENNFWGTWVYKGESLTVDFKTPVETKSELQLHISSVAYGYKDIYRSEVNNFGESSPCNINVVCAPIGTGWENERSSVSLILDANSTALCSGALINNTCNLNIPYLLTANHCFNTIPQQNVAQWKFTFQAWSPICDRLQQQNANGVTFNGSTLRANNAGSDFCLVELTQLPPANSGITFSGWSRNTIGIQNTTIIHHPAGDVMKISRDDQAPLFATFLGSQSWQLVLDQGATNGGSSGAPYYDQNHRIIAQHHGINQNNADQCLNTNKFGGRFDVSWTGGGTNTTRLINWLDPNNRGVTTTDTRGIFGISGPNLICSTGTFTLQNKPGNFGLTWSSSNPSILSINNITGAATRMNGASGNVTVTATLTGGSGCGNTTTSRQVYVGLPTVLDNNGNSTTISLQANTSIGRSPLPCVTSLWPEYTYQHYLEITTDDYSKIKGYVNSITWSGLYAGSSTHWNGRGLNFVPNPPSVNFGSGYVMASAVNTCGSNPVASRGYGQCNPLPNSAFVVYPNPSSAEINIEYVAPQQTETTERIASPSTPSADFEVVLFNDQGKAVLKTQSKNGNVRADVSAFQKGLYTLHIISNGQQESRSVMVD